MHVHRRPHLVEVALCDVYTIPCSTCMERVSLGRASLDALVLKRIVLLRLPGSILLCVDTFVHAKFGVYQVTPGESFLPGGVNDKGIHSVV